MNHPEIKTPLTVDATRQFVNTYPSGRKRRKRSQTQTLFTATKDQLTCPYCYNHLWSMAVSLTHLSSAGWIDAIEEFFRDLDVFGIEIRYPSGEEWPIPYIFGIFPDENEEGDETEAGRRWVSNFKKADQSGNCFASMSPLLHRVRCVELYCHATIAAYSRGPETPRCSMTHFPLGW